MDATRQLSPQDEPVRLSPFALLVLLTSPTLPASVQAQGQGRTARAPSGGLHGANVHGVVFDSIAGRPLGGALVQLVAADSSSSYGQTIAADSAGGFTFPDVPDGHYTIGFLHPLLDSLGIEPMLRAVKLEAHRSVRVDLSLPSPARIRSAICGAKAGGTDGAVVIGAVRNAADGSPASGVRVIAEWLEFSVGKGGLTRQIPRRVATTRESGWFALCDVPNPGTIVLMASRGSDSTDFVEMQVPPSGLLRRELFIGVARVVSADDRTRRDSLTGADSVGSRRPQMHVGDGRLTGSVVTALGGRALAGAQVGIVNGPRTRANERGEWAITDAPAGTRTLEVRAVGFYPARVTINVVQDAPAVRVALATLKSVLDTVKVSANYERYSRFAGFRERSRSGVGRYLLPDEIAQRAPGAVSDLFQAMNGVYVDGGADPERKLMMRGIFQDRCQASIYINGHFMNGMTIGDIDAYVVPKDVVGIEVYQAGTVPAQFQMGELQNDSAAARGNCGSVAIWAK